MKLEDMKPCPFCGAVVEEHPSPEWRKEYWVVAHRKNCYLYLVDCFAGGGKRLMARENKSTKAWNRRFEQVSRYPDYDDLMGHREECDQALFDLHDGLENTVR